MKLIFSNLDFKIVSSSINGDSATVKTEITNLDMKSIMGEYVTEAFKFATTNAFLADNKKISEEDVNKKIEQMLIDILSRKDNKKIVHLQREQTGQERKDEERRLLCNRKNMDV